MNEMVIQALSGLGIFLFGMLYLEMGLRDASGSKFRIFLRKFTNNTPKALITGAFTTAVLQSSSVVSLMALSFVGAGLFSLTSAIGVIFGSNLGTTFTGWIIATLGFKIKVSAFALPLAGFGGLVFMFFGKNQKINAISRIFIGFGLLFLGLDFLKNATEGLSASVDLSQYSDYNVVFFALIGFVITAIIQSSAATTVIILSSLFAGIIDFQMAAAAMIGTNIGTTATAILGAIGGTPDKKRAAVAHFLFNINTAIVALLMLDFLIVLIFDVIGIKDEAIGLALFHTIFNVIGIAMLAPFTSHLSKYLKLLFREKTKSMTLFIDKVDIEVPDAGFEALKNEVVHLYDEIIRYSLALFGVNVKALIEERKKVKKVLKLKQVTMPKIATVYDNIKELEILIHAFARKLNAYISDERETKYINELQHGIRQAIHTMKLLKDSRLNLEELSDSENIFIKKTYAHLKYRITQFSKQMYFLLEGESNRLEKSDKIYKSIEEEYEKTQTNITKSIAEYKLTDQEASNILNTNQTIALVCGSLLEVGTIIISAIDKDKDKEELAEENEEETAKIEKNLA